MKHTIFNLKGKIYLNLFKRIEILYSIQDIYIRCNQSDSYIYISQSLLVLFIKFKFFDTIIIENLIIMKLKIIMKINHDIA